MNIALIGYGKMGREIEVVLKERGHTVVLVVDRENAKELNTTNLKATKVDVAIEFSTPNTAYNNITTCIRAGVPIVSGTTGWLERFEEVAELCEKHKGTLFYASNYSVGVNVMFHMNEILASLMNPFQQYDVTVEEAHHTQKQDAPSGTAITIAEKIVANLERKKKWVSGTTTKADELEVVSIRRGVVSGTHTITYESPEDQLLLMHTAKNRRGFAMGAVLAAEFVANKKGIFTMNDLLGF